MEYTIIIKIKEGKMKTKKHLIFIFVLAFIAVVTLVGGVWAYWAGAVSGKTNEKDNYTVEIGEGKTVETEINLSDNFGNYVLVPAGRSGVSNSVPNLTEQITFNLTVVWKEKLGLNQTTGVKGNGQVSVADVKIGGSTDNAGLVNVSFSETNFEIDLKGDTQKVIQVTVTLTEPGSAAVYEAIKGKNITFKLVVNVVPQ